MTLSSETPPKKQKNEDDAGAIGAEIQDDDQAIDFRKMLACPGTFHIIENIQKRMMDGLNLWKKLKVNLSSVCIYFHRPHTRGEFIHLYLIPSGREHMQALFSSGPPLLQGGRVWGVVVESLEWYFERMDLLDATWPHVAEAADEEHHDDAVDAEPDIDDGVYDDTVHRRRLNRSLHKPFFKGGCTAMLSLARYLGHQ